MTKEELENKCTERAKIFQQAMESCHSSSPIDCIEWFADRIAELEKENARLATNEKSLLAERKIIVKENAEAKNQEYNDLFKGFYRLATPEERKNLNEKIGQAKNKSKELFAQANIHIEKDAEEETQTV